MAYNRTLEKLSTEYVGDAFQRRHGDTAWRLRARDSWLHVVVMLEFQSTTDTAMALRVLEYTALLYGELLRNRKATPGALPAVLPIVLYNGDSPWTPADEMRNLIAAPQALAPYQPSQRHFVLDQRRAVHRGKASIWAARRASSGASAWDTNRASSRAWSMSGSCCTALRRRGSIRPRRIVWRRPLGPRRIRNA